jgi:DNA modification methylase
MTQLKFETWPIERLIEYARNPRKNDHAVDKIAGAIKEFGFRIPVVAKSDGLVVDGHLRLKAAKKLGLTEVPVILADDMTEAQIKAFRISVNRMAEFADWDNELLALEFSELTDMGFDLDMTGFTADEIAALTPEQIEPGLTDEDAVPEEPEQPITVLGDVWVLGKHRLMCGDSTSINAVERLLNGASIDLVHTDPPYGISESAAKRVSRETNSLAKSNSHLPEFNDATTDAARDAFALCEGMGIKRQVWWGANYYAHALPETANWFVWDKRVEEKQKDVNSDCELAWVKSKWSSVRIFRHLWKGLIKESERGQARVHPTQKPVALVEWVIDYYRDVKTVLDLFGGSGSTLIGCEKKGCEAFLMELEPYYCDVIVKRWQDFTGKIATHAETKQPFAEVKNDKQETGH